MAAESAAQGANVVGPDRTPPADVHARGISPVLDADEVAYLLHLGSGREVMKLVRARVLPHVRLGPKRVLFLLDSVLAALKRREVADPTDGDVTPGQENAG